MGPRPESVEAILSNYNTILQQVSLLQHFCLKIHTLTLFSLPSQTPADTLSKTTRTPKIQKAVDNDKHDSPFSLARSGISRVPKRKPAIQTEASAAPSSSVRSTNNRNIEVIDLSGDIEDQKDSLAKVYPARKHLCPLDFTSRPEVKKEEHEADLNEKVADEFVASLLDKTPSKKPKME